MNTHKKNHLLVFSVAFSWLLLSIFSISTTSAQFESNELDIAAKGRCLFHQSQPRWDQALNFKQIERCLKNASIKKMTPMLDHLNAKNYRSDFEGKDVLLVELSCGLKAVFKCDSDKLHHAYAEVAAYRASEYLGIHMVPPTVIKTHNQRRGSLQLYIEPSIDLLKGDNYTAIMSKVNSIETANMNIFYFLFGQWDYGAHNTIAQENRGKIHLALIDNAGIRTRQKVQYGQFPYIQTMESDRFKCTDWATPFKFDPKKTPLTQDAVDQDLGEYLTKEEITSLLDQALEKEIHYVIWRNGFWRQWHTVLNDYKPIRLSYFPKKTMARVRALTQQDLDKIFLERSKMSFIKGEYFADLLNRRDQLLKAEQEFLKAESEQ